MDEYKCYLYFGECWSPLFRLLNSINKDECVQQSNNQWSPCVSPFSTWMNEAGDNHRDFFQNANDTPHFFKLMLNWSQRSLPVCSQRHVSITSLGDADLMRVDGPSYCSLKYPCLKEGEHLVWAFFLVSLYPLCPRNSSLKMALEVMNFMTSGLLIPSGPSWEMNVFPCEVRRAALSCCAMSVWRRAVIGP